MLFFKDVFAHQILCAQKKSQCIYCAHILTLNKFALRYINYNFIEENVSQNIYVLFVFILQPNLKLKFQFKHAINHVLTFYRNKTFKPASNCYNNQQR